MSRCIELPSVSWARSSSPIAVCGSTSSAPSARPTAQRLLDRADEVGAQLGRGADLAEQLVVGAGGAGERVQAHELRPHHLRLGGRRRPARAARRRRRARAAAPASASRGAGRSGWPCRRAGTGSCARPRPAAGRSASTRIVPASTVPGAKRSRSSARWSSPLSSGSTSAGSAAIRSQRRLQPGGLGGDDQRVDRLLSRATARGCAMNSPSVTLLTRSPARRSSAAVGLARDDDHLLARALAARRRAGRRRRRARARRSSSRGGSDAARRGS